MPFAYIDPGSGSMLLQVIVAGALAVPFFFRRVITDTWRRIRGGHVEPSQAGYARPRGIAPREPGSVSAAPTASTIGGAATAAHA